MPALKPVGLTEIPTVAGVVAEIEGAEGVTLTLSIGLLVTTVGVTVPALAAVVLSTTSRLIDALAPVGKSYVRRVGAEVNVDKPAPVTARVTGIVALALVPLLTVINPPYAPAANACALAVTVNEPGVCPEAGDTLSQFPADTAVALYENAAPLEAIISICVGGDDPAAVVKLSVVGVSTGPTVCAANCAQPQARRVSAKLGTRLARTEHRC